MACFYVTGDLELIISKTVISTSTSSTNGGVIRIDEGMAGALTLTLDLLDVSTIKAGGKGGFLYAPTSSKTSNIVISNSKFSVVNSTSDGGILYLGGVNA